MKLLPLALPLILLLAACGQAGALYLPEAEPKPVPQAPTPAVAQPPETTPAATPAAKPAEAPAPAVARPKNETPESR